MTGTEMPSIVAKARLGQPLDRQLLGKLDDEAQGRARAMRHAHDAEPAHLDEAGERRRRAHRKSVPLRCTSVWSSATRRAPSSMRRKARSDLPLPDGPCNRTPASPIAIEVP